MRILIVTRSFYPRISPRSFRATELAKEFSRLGHEVTVYTIQLPNSIPSKLENVNIYDYTKGRDTRQKSNVSFPIKVIRKFAKYFILYPSIKQVWEIPIALSKEGSYDFIISIAVPYTVHWGTAIAMRKNKHLAKTWVADCGDPFMGNKYANRLPPPYFHLVERWFCKQPDYISVPVEDAKFAYPSFCRNKIKVIPQGFSITEEDLNSKNENNKPINNVTTFLYAGSLDKEYRDPRPLLDHISNAGHDFRFIVYTNNKEILIEHKNLLKEKVEIHDYIPRDDLLQVMKKCDFTICFKNPSSVQAPSKLIDYQISGRPVLEIGKDLPVSTIEEFIAGNYKNRMFLPDLDAYRIENVARQFIVLAHTN